MLLAEFVACAERAGQRTVTTEFALQWARRPATGSHNYLSRRLRAVRTFARYLHALDPACEVPPIGAAAREASTGQRHTSIRDAEIVALMAAASTLRPPFRAATFQTLIGLLACTGLRIGEALRLDRDDFDLADGVLTVRDSKFGKSSEVLLHPSTVQALLEYGELRDRLCPQPPHARASSSPRAARRPSHPTICQPFHKLLEQAGITHPSPGRQVRVHDLRHRFAVKTLLGWYRDGDDVAARMPLLSTYMGHVDPAATFWYLSAAPELLALAAERLEQTAGERR